MEKYLRETAAILSDPSANCEEHEQTTKVERLLRRVPLLLEARAEKSTHTRAYTRTESDVDSPLIHSLRYSLCGPAAIDTSWAAVTLFVFAR